MDQTIARFFANWIFRCNHKVLQEVSHLASAEHETVSHNRKSTSVRQGGHIPVWVHEAESDFLTVSPFRI
jgi:hypothetical protein